ncbi:ATP-binding cassette glutathione S-conjugate transporter ycf1 [Coemansia erecta]|uniref:ATP-binding cassette glutathione S-conjugate transporter ycf1 n=1 Tax=Coemansia erecta TaxID=147472 RepID=A0A9W7Y7I6_9FUNG|nr:ATP-binding cassette glutathione S-conjugate transporter ycf1 [Coemansia erecta]
MLTRNRELEINDISNPENESEFKEYTRKTNMDTKKRIEALLYTKAVEFYLESHSESYGVWEFQSKIQNIANGIVVLCFASSAIISQLLNVWIVAQKVGWRVLIPIIFALAHQLLSRAVNRKIDRLRKMQRISKTPRFQDNYYYTFRNIRTIKFYGWESAFTSSRGWIDLEFYSPPMIWKVTRWFISIVGCAISQISAALTIISYFSVSSNAISYADMSLLMSSIDSLTSFTQTITGIGETITGVKKGMAFLESLVDTTAKSYIVHKTKADLPSDVAIELNECVFTWGEDKFALKPMSMRIKQGEFVTVIGRVGGGKSSFVSGLCGEMAISSGSGYIHGKVGYVSQKPFIMNATFRENVTMNTEYDEKLMEKVLKASVLLDDIKKLPAGDMTEIGSNGVNLSGGQKVRLALARALYLNADVYIFDDLLSAVDARVERLLIERVLSSSGIIGSKTRVLVTHAEHVVPLSCKVITLTDGAADVVEQKPADLAILSNLNSSSSDGNDDEEISDKIEHVDKDKAEFTVHPELKDPVLRMSQFLKFAKMSGYGVISIVLGFELIRAYILHHTEGLRIQLMTDSNPDTIRQSLTKYLIVNAALTIGGLQLIIFNRWIRETLWSDKVTKVTRTKLIDTILTLPLPMVEQLSHVTLVDISATVSYYATINVIYNSYYLLSLICTEITRNSVLGFKLWQRFYMGIPVQPGEVDALSRLSSNTVQRVTKIATLLSGHDEEFQALARYYIYTEKLAREAPAVIEDCRPPSSWPEGGVVEFCDYSMRYRSELDLVLKGLTFSTSSSEKIGIVGRTGAGKSSITYALMRMVEPASGQIKIDGIDISTIGIRDLRSQIAIIPQDPTLFEGTIRDNLDPTHEYTDDEVWAAIRAGKIENLLEKPTEKYVEKKAKDDDDDDDSDRGPWTEGIGLNKWVEYNGNNFSVGQRQLVSLCRALLWRRKVVVLDEATANVDGETDKTMQEVIRCEFKNCTVLTIAHRLGTIMDNDRILVMDQGRAAEFDTPQNLLTNKDSIFSRLVANMKTTSEKK